MPRRIVLIGATGFFGQRLARRLASIDGIDLILTSRREERAKVLAREFGGGRIGALAFVRDDAASTERLRSLSPWLVIDASGPFQATSYDLTRTAIGLGAHWIDLADARDYLLGFGPTLDDVARENGVVARTGASSTPALSMAVVEELTRGWRRVDSIDIAIMPGGAGNVGESVIRAILSYSGAPVDTFTEGQTAKTTGWGSVRRIRVDGLGLRYVSPVETADAALMQPRFAVTSRILFGAGLESRIEHFGLLALSHLKGRGLVSDLEPLAPLLVRARAMTRPFASDRGGMSVDCAGLDGGRRQTSARWLLLAEPGQGPDVPVLPAVALTRALLRGDAETGARVASLPLHMIEAEMSPPSLVTSRTIALGSEASLIASACGDCYSALPHALKAFHDQDAPAVWTGKADIDASNSIIGRLSRWVFGFRPRAAKSTSR